MTDYFALLGARRGPWLDPEDVRRTFLALSAQCHPDRVHEKGEAERQAAQSRYLELNAAYQCLQEPKGRLRHLLELELGAMQSEAQQIPADVVDLFMEIGPVCRQADQLRAEGHAITSPVLKAQWFERALLCRDKVQGLRRKLDERTDRLLDALKKIDAEWNSGDTGSANKPVLLKRLDELHRRFSYFDRWREQLQERFVQLSV